MSLICVFAFLIFRKLTKTQFRLDLIVIVSNGLKMIFIMKSECNTQPTTSVTAITDLFNAAKDYSIPQHCLILHFNSDFQLVSIWSLLLLSDNWLINYIIPEW